MAALLLSLSCAGASAQDAPPRADPARPVSVDPKTLQKQADDLRDSVSDMSISPVRLHLEAGRLFTSVQSQTPNIRVDWAPVERERVDGRIGTIDGMIAAANGRFDQYRLRFNAPPPPEVTDSAQVAQALKDQGRVNFEKKGAMAENQMGVFRYDVARLDGGIVELNRRMALLATRIGEAFAYATLVHEATHARDREKGLLTPEHEIDGEVHAFYAQYLWLTTMDPTGMRLVVLRSTLDLWRQSHPDDAVTAQAIRYLDNLSALYMTEGKEDKLKKFVESLGYEDGDRPATPAAPAPVRA